jgi:hypothetical protein
LRAVTGFYFSLDFLYGEQGISKLQFLAINFFQFLMKTLHLDGSGYAPRSALTKKAGSGPHTVKQSGSETLDTAMRTIKSSSIEKCSSSEESQKNNLHFSSHMTILKKNCVS